MDVTMDVHEETVVRPQMICNLEDGGWPYVSSWTSIGVFVDVHSDIPITSVNNSWTSREILRHLCSN